MGPEMAKAWVKRQVERQSTRRSTAVLGAVDTTPPQLTKFDSVLTVDASKPIAPASFSAIDDKSGVLIGGGYAVGPSGQALYVSFSGGFPQRKLSGVMRAYGERGYLEAGTYVFSWIYLGDVAGNYAYYDRDQLAALGNASMIMKNKNGYDALPPTLTSGQVLTPVVSLADKQPGTSSPAYMGISVRVTDVGTTAVAGVNYVSSRFCLLDESSCFYLASGAGQPGQAAAVLRLGGQVDPTTMKPGDYHLQSLYLSDNADNYRNLESTEFAGDTDFSTYFGSTVITVAP